MKLYRMVKIVWNLCTHYLSCFRQAALTTIPSGWQSLIPASILQKLCIAGIAQSWQLTLYSNGNLCHDFSGVCFPSCPFLGNIRLLRLTCWPARLPPFLGAGSHLRQTVVTCLPWAPVSCSRHLIPVTWFSGPKQPILLELTLILSCAHVPPSCYLSG